MLAALRAIDQGAGAADFLSALPQAQWRQMFQPRFRLRCRFNRLTGKWIVGRTNMWGPGLIEADSWDAAMQFCRLTIIHASWEQFLKVKAAHDSRKPVNVASEMTDLWDVFEPSPQTPMPATLRKAAV